ncbi:MAG TPA: ATP-binding protein [Chryseolinea sp.]|nr:ATP-binding protein [Chryseolinea sp.]
MAYFKNKLSITSVTKKVIAGFVLVFVAILMALGITHFGFREMMDTVDQLSAPNEKLAVLNSIFQQITASEQAQRAEAIKNPKNPYSVYLNQSKTFVSKIDSLMLLDWDSTQQIRLLEIKGILQRRNRLFLSYLKLKTELIDNRSLSHRLDTLSRILVNERVAYDTNVVTTEKKTITTYTTDSVAKEQDKRTKLAKLFSRKKNNPPPTTHVKVEEQLSVVVDTLSIARQNKALAEVDKIIADLESDQRKENKRLMTEELELIHANSLFINQLLSILHDVENEEVSRMHANNDRAGQLVTESIWRISMVLIIFFIFAACLVYLIWLDITRSNYYKEQLEKAKDEAEELSQIKQRFLANMSHEIRTPLQSIIGFAEQLREHRTNNHEAIEAINSSSEHLLHIVDEVLDYSRISSGSLVFSKENFQLLSLVKEVGAALHIQAERKGLTLLLDVEYADDLTVVGDPFRLRQILYNLVGNAIKFTSKGFVKLGVRTSQQHENVQCVFEVTDTGIGIRKEDLAKIFNQFEQANALITRRFGGTGLGLTIAKSLIEAQGGTLDVTSEPGHGSVFTISIPFTRSTEVEVLPQLHQQQENQPLFTGKVIVVDDDVLILRLCGLVLGKNGIQYTTYSDARKLMYEDVDSEVTHILMDIRMPEINGVELCHALRKKYVPSTRFIALTAHVFPQEHQQLLQEGFDFVMLKPFREQELMSLFGGVRTADSPVDDAGIAIDLSLLKAMTQGDELLLQSILNQFIEETSADLELLQEYLKRAKVGLVREVVHKLAGRTGQVGASLLAGQLRNMENRLAEGEPLENLVVDLRLLSGQVQKVLIAIKEKNDALQLAK